jgi:hypothetical protein
MVRESIILPTPPPTLKLEPDEIILWDKIAVACATIMSQGLPVLFGEGGPIATREAMSIGTALAAGMADRMIEFRRMRTNRVDRLN